MHTGKNTLRLLALLFHVLFLNTVYAECREGTCNLERESRGMWYGDANLIGPVNRDGLSEAPYASWFNSNYDNYQVNRDIISKIRWSGRDLRLKAFMGTWCSDSRRHIPGLYRILDELELDAERLDVHAMGIVPGEFRRTHDGTAEKGKNIYRVPTIIVEENGVELGRIIESPAASLEEDLLAIVQDGNYVPPAYILEGEVNGYLEKHGVEKFEQDTELLAKKFRAKGIKAGELDHYIAYNLLYSQRYREAAAVINMMLSIYPEAGHLHMALAKTYELLNEDRLALDSYGKAFSYLDDAGNLDLIRGALKRSAAAR